MSRTPTPLVSNGGNRITDAAGLSIYEESDLTPPPGVATHGALIADTPPCAEYPAWRDEFPTEIIDPSDWKQYIDAGSGDHTEYCNWVLDQNGHGSCAAEGLVHCCDAQRERRGLKAIKFNPWCLYYFSSGGVDRGSSLTANIREAKKRGLVPMELWPRYGSGAHRWNDVPPPSSPIWKEAAKYKPGEVYDIGNTNEAVSALFRGHCVYAAYPGHAWQLVKPLNTQQGLWRNSWGSSWDGDGYGVISYSRITFQYGLFAIATVTV